MTISFAVTTGCNRRCPDCCAGIGRVAQWWANQAYMARWAPVFRGVDVVNIYGGEPMCHPRFDALTAALPTWFSESRLWLSTNGDLWERHAAAVAAYERVIVSHYGEWTFSGCPANSAAVDGLRGWVGERLVVSRVLHEVPVAGRSNPCWRLHGEALEFRQGVLYPCCAGSGVPGAVGIVPGADWPERISECRAVCAGCAFAT